jgi:hypothetical protein
MRLIALWELVTIALLLAEVIDYIRTSRSVSPVAAFRPRRRWREFTPSSVTQKVVRINEIRARAQNFKRAPLSPLQGFQGPGSAAVVSLSAWRAARPKRLREDRSLSNCRGSLRERDG